MARFARRLKDSALLKWIEPAAAPLDPLLSQWCHMSEPEFIDPSQIRPGPIRHDTLSPEVLAHIKAVYDVIGRYLDMNLEQFEIGFMRDLNPEIEVALWCSITAAWLDYHEKFVGKRELSGDKEQKLVAALIAISTGVEDVGKLGLPVTVGKRLLQCYDDLGKV